MLERLRINVVGIDFGNRNLAHVLDAESLLRLAVDLILLGASGDEQLQTDHRFEERCVAALGAKEVNLSAIRNIVLGCCDKLIDAEPDILLIDKAVRDGCAVIGLKRKLTDLTALGVESFLYL